ncbi:MAG: ribonuclease III [Planctomycetota bacterium]|nr:MAG: ribonuclease III [Planctomycetota bacterium]
MENEKLKKCQELLGIQFSNPKILEESLTHSSAYHNGVSNERLEFLGDSVLGLITTEYLYQKFPHYNEGELTKLRSAIVSRKTLAKISLQLNLGQYCYLGTGLNADKLPTSILANIFEAIVAAIYLDQGYPKAKKFVLDHLKEIVLQYQQDIHRDDYKSALQDFCQKNFGITPVYNIVKTQGPDHRKVFEAVVKIGDRIFMEQRASGRRKKIAEQAAAKNTLEFLDAQHYKYKDFFKQPKKKSLWKKLKKLFCKD